MEAHTPELSAPPVRSRTIDDDLKRLRAHEESLLDDALAATFPCSDPVSSLSVDEVGEGLASPSALEK
jgi:hypothetical protein